MAVSIPALALRGLEVSHPPQILLRSAPAANATFQVFFAVVILGLSGHLVASQAYGGAPSVTNYQVFVGIYLLVISLVGLAAGFVSALGGVVMVALDALAILFTFAGGVVSPPLSIVRSVFLQVANECVTQAYAAQLGAHDCSCNKPNSSCSYLVNNVIINGGKNHEGAVNLDTNRVMRCHEAQADTAFLWFAFAAFCATFALSFLAWRRK